MSQSIGTRLRQGETALGLGSQSLEHVDRNAPRNTITFRIGAEDGSASRLVSSLAHLTLDDDTLLGEESRTTVRLQEVQKTELSLRLLRDDLPTILCKVYAETGEYLTGLGEILSTADKYRSSGVLSERMKSDGNVMRESMTMIDKRLDRLGISDQNTRGMYATTETRCCELNNRAKVGQLSGEGSARLARLMALKESRWGALCAVGLLAVIFAVFRLFLYNGLVDKLRTLTEGTVFAAVYQLLEMACWLGVVVAAILLIYHGIQADRIQKQCVDVENKSRRWIRDLRQMQKFAVLPRECFTTAAGIVDAVKRNLQGVLDAVDINDVGAEGHARSELVEGQLSVFYGAVDEQQQKLKQLKEALQQENLKREELQKEFTAYDFSKL